MSIKFSRTHQVYIPNKYYIFPIYIFCIFDFDHNWIHYQARHPNLRPRSRSYSSNSYYSCSAEPGGGSSVIHQGHVRQTKEPDKIIMTPVTPDQSIRGLDSSWSVVQGSGMTLISINIKNIVARLLKHFMCLKCLMSSAFNWSLHDWKLAIIRNCQ